jgi:hypothetical protein
MTASEATTTDSFPRCVWYQAKEESYCVDGELVGSASCNEESLWANKNYLAGQWIEIRFWQAEGTQFFQNCISELVYW